LHPNTPQFWKIYSGGLSSICSWINNRTYLG
jgi:hypothetical protein